MARYIDAEKLLNRMKKDPLFPIVERYGVSGVIEAEPTAEVQEVRHGKWLEVKECPFFCTCSKCGGFGSKALNYCPNCGARMDK